MPLATYVNFPRIESDAIDVQAAPRGLSLTDTGLDLLLDMALNDQGLNRRVERVEFVRAVEAMAEMNGMIVQAIDATGIGGDGVIEAAEIHTLSGYVAAEFHDEWVLAHGDDAAGVETGFHLIQRDGATTRLMGENGVDTIADGLYHLGFGTYGNTLVNEDGDRNAEVDDVAFWLNALLAEDLKAGTFARLARASEASTGTGLDVLVTTIETDPGLLQRVPLDDIQAGAAAADRMNEIIVEGIEELGLATDGTLSTAEIYALSDWIRTSHRTPFTRAHGDDEDGIETGFHRVQNDGAISRLFGDNAVNTVADGIYHLVFGYDCDRLINEDGDRNARVEQVAYWLNELLAEDLTGWRTEPEGGGDWTGLDAIAGLIAEDPELNRKLPLDQILDAMAAAQGMNAIIVEAIRATGVAYNGTLSAGDVRDIADWINTNRYDEWLTLHGDDEYRIETGYHLVQNDGAVTRLFGANAIDTVADGIYHLGFGYDRGRIINEDGDHNASLDQLAFWMSDLLADELSDGSLRGDANPYEIRETGTGLDRLAEALFRDPRLTSTFATSDLAEAAGAAGRLNAMLLDAIRATGAANDGGFTAYEIGLIDAWIAENVLRSWDHWGGRDDPESSGFGKVLGEGASVHVEGVDAVDGMARALYALGHGLSYGTGVLDRDGRWIASTDVVAEYLNALLARDLEAGTLVNRDLLPVDPETFADALVAELDGPMSVAEGTGSTQIAHDADQEIDEGAIAISFTANSVDGYDMRVLLSKDATGYDGGGHTTIWVADGKVHARLQSDDETWTLSSPRGSIVPGRPADIVLNFGPDGAALYLDGEKVAENDEAVISWAGNDNPIAIGESRMTARDDSLTGIDTFDGEIAAVRVYDRPLEMLEILGLDRPAPPIAPGAPALAAEDAVRTVGNGLFAEIYDTDAYIRSVDVLIDGIESGDLDRTHVASVETVAFYGNNDQPLSDFLSDNGEVLTGNGATAVQTMGFHLSGYIWINEGRHSFTVRSDDGFALRIGGEEIIRFTGDRATAPTTASAEFEGGLYEIDLYYFDNGGSQALKLMMDGKVVDASRLYDSIDSFESAPVYDRSVDGPNLTGTGLDTLWAWTETDSGLLDRTSYADRKAGSEAAEGMNAIIVEAIRATGAADDGTLSTGEVYDISDWINENRYDAWLRLHGNDEDGIETGFHRVQNDGGELRAFGEAAINTVADGIYHLGFGYYGDRLLNEDGDRNVRVSQVAYWLNALLGKDLQAGSLVSGNDRVAEATTGTGLDRLIEIAVHDMQLSDRIPEAELIEATEAMNVMNEHIVHGIRRLGLANDGEITAAETAGLSDYIARNFADSFIAAHGDDEDGIETGFHLVQNDGAISRLYAENAINTVADGIYHLVFGHSRGRLINEDGNPNASLEDVGAWLTQLLQDDMARLANGSRSPVEPGDTGTGLDQFVTLIADDPGLNLQVTLADLKEGAAAANEINHMIVEGIVATGIARDKQFNAADMRLLSDWIAETYNADGEGAFALAHGDDEHGIETGYHRVQNDGANARIFGENAINTVLDGIYHLGFGYRGDRLINEDGDNNQTLSDVAYWLEAALADDIASGNLVVRGESANPYVRGTTGTGLDDLVEIITRDDALGKHLSTSQIAEAAAAADDLNALLLDAFEATQVTADGQLSGADLKDVSMELQDTAARTWARLHGEDSGFDLAWNAGSALFGRWAVSEVADAIYNLGFGFRADAVVNENGHWDENLGTVAGWLTDLLGDAITDGSLAGRAVTARNFDGNAVAEFTDRTIDSGADATSFWSGTARDEGTFVAIFTADNPGSDEAQTLVARGTQYDDDGTFRLRVKNDRLELELRQDGTYMRLDSGDLTIETGETYTAGFTFDDDRIGLYLNGSLVDVEMAPGIDFGAMDSAMVLGAAHYERWDGTREAVNVFDGEIREATLYDEALNNADMAYLG